jgi:hypothetical protein
MIPYQVFTQPGNIFSWERKVASLKSPVATVQDIASAPSAMQWTYRSFVSN